MDKANPLGMWKHILGEPDDGVFVLPPQRATIARRDYLERGQRILGAYAGTAAYSEKGRESVEFQKQSGVLKPSTPIRLKINTFVLQASLKKIEQLFAGAGEELTRQFFVGVYGSFEAFLFDHVVAAFEALEETQPELAARDLILSLRWRGKLDRISQKFELGLQGKRLKESFQHLEMGMFGKRIDDPIELLEAAAALRHRIAHSSGRAEQTLLDEYPDSGLEVGQLITLPFELPLELWFFFVPLTEEIDKLFAGRFGLKREEVRPESL